jgi:alpha-beta hydrolase superfamily lysophospholipase
MQHSEGRFTGVGGVELYRQQWLPASEPRAAVVIVHGVGEYSGRYPYLVGPLVDAGYAVFGYDQRGHGASPGTRVYIDSWSQYRDDLDAYLRVVAESLPGVPLLVYGHSMGSLVVLDYLLQPRPALAGAIISGAALEPTGVGKPWQIVAARLLSRIAPRFSIDLGIDAASLSHDEAVVAAYRADPLVSSGATARWGAESLATVERIKAGMGGIDLPLLVLHGGEDPLNRVGGAQTLYDAVSSRDKTLKIYPGAYHEPHNDMCHDELASDVKEWLGHLTV